MQVKTKILICSYSFYPNLGGLELTSEKLAYWLVKKGFDVSVITFTPNLHHSDDNIFPFKVIRCPSKLELFLQIKNHQYIISKHLSIKCCWPLLFLNRIFLIWHATWYPQQEHILIKLLKNKLMSKAVNIANSKAIAGKLVNVKDIIYPGYSEIDYKNIINWDDRNGFAYLGRLSREKGCDILIKAFSKINNSFLIIIGDGNEKKYLESLSQELDITEKVVFVGRKTPSECNLILNKVRVLVVPSVYDEPFGTVALEGLAAGCRVIVSSGGGLSEAAGSTGIVFKSGDENELSKCMEYAIQHPYSIEEENEKTRHLKENSFDIIANKLVKQLGIDIF